jgi:hypothetical protein
MLPRKVRSGIGLPVGILMIMLPRKVRSEIGLPVGILMIMLPRKVRSGVGLPVGILMIMRCYLSGCPTVVVLARVGCSLLVCSLFIVVRCSCSGRSRRGGRSAS